MTCQHLFVRVLEIPIGTGEGVVRWQCIHCGVYEDDFDLEEDEP